MNRLFLAVVLFVLLLSAGGRAVYAQNVKTTEQFIATVRQTLQEQYNVPKQDVLIVWDDDPLEKKLSQLGPNLSAQINPADLKSLIGKNVLMLNVIKENTLYRKLTVKMSLDVWITAFQPTRPIQKDEPFTEDNTKKVRLILSTLPKNFIQSADSIISQVAYRNLTNERVITTDMVKSIPIINKGETVKVIVVSDGVQLTAQGTALEDAKKNQMFRIKVLNFQGSKIVYAQAISPGVARMVVR